jgi:hypothetical protein
MQQPVVCKLCRGPGPLLNSHIIPELCFRPLYDAKHRATEVRTGVKGRRLIQKGKRERLLCGRCEQRLGGYERHFSQVWFVKRPLAGKVGDLLTLTGLDYNRFKCFHLSIMWRCSVSASSDFDTVDLGPRHNENIRQLLLSGSGGPAWQYPLWCIAAVNRQGAIAYDVISRPGDSRLDGHRVYYFLHSGCEWIFFVSSHRNIEAEEPAFTSSGALPVLFEPLDDTISFKRYKTDRAGA